VELCDLGPLEADGDGPSNSHPDPEPAVVVRFNVDGVKNVLFYRVEAHIYSCLLS